MVMMKLGKVERFGPAPYYITGISLKVFCVNNAGLILCIFFNWGVGIDKCLEGGGVNMREEQIYTNKH